MFHDSRGRKGGQHRGVRGYLDRRSFLAALGGALVGDAARAASEGPRRFVPVALANGDEENPRPRALRQLLWEIQRRTSVESANDPLNLGPCDARLAYHPFAFMSVRREVAPLADCAARTLRTYLRLGGTLVVDGVEGGPGTPFAKSVQRVFAPLLGSEVRAVPQGHVIYHSFYMLRGATGRVLRTRQLDGIEVDGRFAVVISHDDLAGAWERDNFGLWTYELDPGGEQQREESFRLGINLVMYAMCIDYKDDRVHLPFILRKRKLF